MQSASRGSHSDQLFMFMLIGCGWQPSGSFARIPSGRHRICRIGHRYETLRKGCDPYTTRSKRDGEQLLALKVSASKSIYYCFPRWSFQDCTNMPRGRITLITKRAFFRVFLSPSSPTVKILPCSGDKQEYFALLPHVFSPQTPPLQAKTRPSHIHRRKRIPHHPAQYFLSTSLFTNTPPSFLRRLLLQGLISEEIHQTGLRHSR